MLGKKPPFHIAYYIDKYNRKLATPKQFEDLQEAIKEAERLYGKTKADHYVIDDYGAWAYVAKKPLTEEEKLQEEEMRRQEEEMWNSPENVEAREYYEKQDIKDKKEWEEQRTQDFWNKELDKKRQVQKAD